MTTVVGGRYREGLPFSDYSLTFGCRGDAPGWMESTRWGLG
jgi:hypothetical protein